MQLSPSRGTDVRIHLPSSEESAANSISASVPSSADGLRTRTWPSLIAKSPGCSIGSTHELRRAGGYCIHADRPGPSVGSMIPGACADKLQCTGQCSRFTSPREHRLAPGRVMVHLLGSNNVPRQAASMRTRLLIEEGSKGRDGTRLRSPRAWVWSVRFRGPPGCGPGRATPALPGRALPVPDTRQGGRAAPSLSP